jgi:PDZ domain-containing protein
VSLPRYLSRPPLLITVALVIAAQFIPLPYVVMQPGPAYDLLGKNVSFTSETTTSDSVNSSKSSKSLLSTYPVSGKLYALTVLVSNPDAHITAPIIIAGWIDGHSVVLPRDFVYPEKIDSKKVQAEGEREMQGAQDLAAIAAATFLAKTDPQLAKELRSSKVSFELKETGGPSAGLGFAIAIVAKIKAPSLIDGRKIAVTGTINETGTVGAIGGIDQKLIGASVKGAKVILIPAGNCSDITRKPAHLQIVPIHSLNEAIHFLSGAITPAPHC